MEWLLHLLEVAGKAAPLIVSIIFSGVAIIFSGVVGYIVGAAKTFREQKLRAYEEALPIFIKAAFEQQKADEPEFNKAIHKLWLFASKKVARKVDGAVAILVKPNRGDALRALQEVIAEMRADIQFCPWQRLNAEEIEHFYTKFGN